MRVDCLLFLIQFMINKTWKLVDLPTSSKLNGYMGLQKKK